MVFCGLGACTSAEIADTDDLDTAETDVVETDAVETDTLETDGIDTDDTGDLLKPTFTAGGWNLESGGATIEGIGSVFPAVEGVSLWGLSETEAEWAPSLATMAGAEPFDYVLGTTGYSDRLLILWDPSVFEKVDEFEVEDVNLNGSLRAPLVVHLRVREGGREFLFMVNHLWRSDSEGRSEQAELLNAWVTSQGLPVIAVGDYNFDWSVTTDDHDPAYDKMVENGDWTWVRPDVLSKTQCSDYNSVLDFAFVSVEVLYWMPDSSILTPDAEWCPDDDTRPDHRPVSLEVTLPG